MSSIKVKFRPSSNADREGTIYYQIIQERRVRQVISDYKVFPYEWDPCRSNVMARLKSERAPLLHFIRKCIQRDVERITKIDRRLYASGMIYTADDIVEEYTRYAREYSLFNFMRTIIFRLRQTGKLRTSETYISALNSFSKFRKGEDIMLDCLEGEVMEDYEAWIRARGAAPNTVSFYTRILRAVYNRAVEHEIIEDRHPFRHVYTGIDKTVKRAISLDKIKRLRSLDLTLEPMLDYARDMFMLSFYFRGMSFIDMAFLKKSDLDEGRLIYRRRKTGQLLAIEWTKEMQDIIDKYPGNDTAYLLPILRRPVVNELTAYRNIAYRINRSLKHVAKRVGIHIPLTLYVARHSWASVARSKGIPVSVISEGMGHDSESTTRIYLASLDTAIVDRANSAIIRSLR